MTDYFDEQGNKIEAYSPEDVGKLLEDERSKAIEEATADREEEITALNSQVDDYNAKLDALNKELEVEKSKDKNLAGQRKIIENKADEIAKMKEEFDAFKAENQKQISEITSSSERKVIGDMISHLVDGDEEKAKLVKYHFDRFQAPLPEKQDEKDAEIKKRIQDAYTLAVGGKPEVSMTGSIISNMGSAPQINPKGEKLNSEAVGTAHELGLSDADLKKYNLI
jgi:alanyl-tRNA synthetase